MTKKVVTASQFIDTDGGVWHVEPWIMRRAFRAVGEDVTAVTKFLLDELTLFKNKPEEFEGVFSFAVISEPNIN